MHLFCFKVVKIETKKPQGYKKTAKKTWPTLENANACSEKNGQRHFTQNTKIAMEKRESGVELIVWAASEQLVPFIILP